MKWNFKWGKNNKREVTPELTERGVNVYHHENKIRNVEKLTQKECIECGKMFTPSHGSQSTCSDECREEHRRKYRAEWQRNYYKKKKHGEVEPATNNKKEENTMIGTIMRGDKPWTPPTKVCPTCGKKFIAKGNRQVFCSDKCRDKAYALKKNGVELPRRTPGGYVSTAPTEPRKCDICGTEFMPRTKKARYCSQECRREAMRICSREWDKAHGKHRKEYRANYYNTVTKVAQTSAYEEAAAVVRKLIEAGVDNDVVAKYLQTVFGGK